ncbi:MAG: cell division protein ZapA [Alphaproteobacteria bacterium]
MAQVEVTVNGRNYRIACDDGQEDHLVELAEFVNGKVTELVSAVGQVGDARLLVMASLLIADELSETYGALKDGKGAASGDLIEAEAANRLAERIEHIAARLAPA